MPHLFVYHLNMSLRPVFLLTFILALSSPVLSRTQQGKRIPDLNVLLITIDTLRYDRVGTLDARHVKTPNLDALAARSLVFTRAFAHNPVTLASHANILTGATSLYHGISDNTGFRLDRKFLTLPQYLRGRGYATAAFIGAFPLDSRFGLDQGFDLYDDYYGTRGEREFFFVERPAKKVIAPAMAWIGKQSRKWFGWVHLFDPHQPYLPPSPFKEKYAGDPYSGEVAYVDAQLGVLFDFLRARRLLEKTVVIVTADHGEALGEKGEDTHSYFAYNNTLHVPLFIHVPGLKPGRYAGNACHADIFPTLCAVLGQKASPVLQGESLLDIATTGKRKSPEIYFESLTAWLNRDWAPLRGFIAGDTKFIDLPLKEVYDLKTDMGEERNLAGSSKMGPLQNTLNRLMRKLKNPLAAGRESRLDPETQKRLKTLGYIAENWSGQRRRQYTDKDDLKTLLPLQSELLKGVARFQSGDFTGAKKTIQAVIAASPGFIMAYTHLASMYKEMGQGAAVVRVLEQGLAKNPENILLLGKLGVVLADSGDWQRAIPILERVVAQQDFDPEKFNFLGIAYYHGGKLEKALENYRKALRLDHNNASVFNNMGSAYLALFLRDGDKRTFALVVQNFKQALAIDANMFTSYNGLGAAYKYAGRNAEAIAYWQRALAIKPDYDLPLINLGITLLEQGQARQALAYFQKYKEKHYAEISPEKKQRIDLLIAEARAKLEATGKGDYDTR